MNKTFAIGDIHGRFEALKEVLKKSKFNYKKDKLIILGDIVDGGYNTAEVVEELLKIKNKIFILGNHDIWFMNHLKTGWTGIEWINQGGKATLQSYGAKAIQTEFLIDFDGIRIPKTHFNFFNKAYPYYLEKHMLFVHAGFDPKIPLIKNEVDFLTWDRTIIEKCRNGLLTEYKKIFIGHTTTQAIMKNQNYVEPVFIQTPTTKLICLDTGAGWNGKLTIMNVNTEEYWQSRIQKPSVRMK